MKRFLGVILLLAAMTPLWADDVPLTVSGPGVKTVTVADQFPVKVEAPKGAAFYFWTVPAGVTFDDKGDTIFITAAPNGPLTVAVKFVTGKIDRTDPDPKTWDIVYTTVFGKTEVLIGGVAPLPDPVDPEAVPSAALKKAMQDAYAEDTDPQKAAHVAVLARLCAVIVPSLKGKVATAKEFQDAVHSNTNLNLASGRSDGSDALPVLRPAIGAFVSTRLPLTPGAPTDEAYWRAASIAYSQVAQALKGLVK